MTYEEIAAWFAERPKWLQDCAARLIERGKLQESDIAELCALCKSEAGGVTIKHAVVKAGSLSKGDTRTPVRLISISDIHGVNAILGGAAIEFGETPISIVYGRNGSGKSGYVRLLKHVCGDRNVRPVLPNVFESGEVAQSARVEFAKKGDRYKAEWSGASITELEGVEIYDTDCGYVYVNDENEVAYEPWILRLFTALTESATAVADVLRNEKDSLVSHLPVMPDRFRSTSAYELYTKLDAETEDGTLDKSLVWSTDDEQHLLTLRQRFGEADPVAAAVDHRENATTLLQVVSDLKKISRAVSDEVVAKLRAARDKAERARTAANEDANRVFSSAPLDGVGSESWRLLWESARRYSESHAYPAEAFPHLSDDARCVLCQQELSDEALSRFQSFENFVKSDLQERADIAESELKLALAAVPTEIDPSTYRLRVQSTGLKSGELLGNVELFAKQLSSRANSICDSNSTDTLADVPSYNVLVCLVQEARKLAKLARLYDRDATNDDRTAIESEITNAEAQKWLVSNAEAVRDEVGRLRAIATVDVAIGLTSTQAISRRKSSLAEELVTKAYEARFRTEMHALGADDIQVELIKSRTQVGRVYHRIQLNGSQERAKTIDVLSEGEFRVVSLAAFLADTTGRESATPFVFDDPISSLDHVFEERTAKRLCELSKTRQVIVFTHRLSLVGLVAKYAKAAKVDTELIALSRNHVGKVTDLPIELKRTDKAVNQLHDHRLKAIEQAFEKDDSEYDAAAKGLCSDFRILIERVVESDLLNGVVTRFSPEVNTKGKLEALSLVTKEDCDTIDDLMTKYSRFEHSQPSEALVPLPKPAEIREDLEKLRDLIQTLRQRTKQS